MTGQTEEWGDWINHDGKGCPLPEGIVVEVIFEADPGMFSPPEVGVTGCPGISWDWKWWGQPDPWHENCVVARIVKYRVRKPRALLKMIEDVENLPCVREREDA